MVLNFVWVDFVQVPRKCIRCCVAVNGGFVALESVVSQEPAFPVMAADLHGPGELDEDVSLDGVPVQLPPGVNLRVFFSKQKKVN